jgi:hypothetical protein
LRQKDAGIDTDTEVRNMSGSRALQVARFRA